MPKTVPYMRLVRAALEWWEIGRPSGWTTEQHLSNPTVNRHGNYAEEVLAQRCADYVKARRAAASRNDIKQPDAS